MTKERWEYTGPEAAPIHFRSIKGTWGRVKVERAGEMTSARVIDIDGLKLEVPLGLAEEIVAAVTSSLRPYAGFSIFQQIMGKLDEAIADLMEVMESGEADDAEIADLKAQCAVYAECLALIRDPSNPDTDYERARAMERWEAR